MIDYSALKRYTFTANMWFGEDYIFKDVVLDHIEPYAGAGVLCRHFSGFEKARCHYWGALSVTNYNHST